MAALTQLIRAPAATTHAMRPVGDPQLREAGRLTHQLA